MEPVVSLSPGPSASKVLQSVSTDPNIPQIVTAVAASLALLGIALAWLSATRARHASLMADISRRWDEGLLIESRMSAAGFDDPYLLQFYMQVLVEEQSEALFVIQRIPNFFEDLAVLERARAISFRVIRETFGRGVVDTWQQWELAVRFLRQDEEDDTIYEHFENLAVRMWRALEG